MVGIVSTKEAIIKAKNAKLDLVEISPNVDPPVCKIMDFGKYKYELRKKQHEAKKKQKTITVKEIKLRPNIGQHDYMVKLKSVQKFLADGDKVKFTLRFRGREIANLDIKDNVITKFKEDIADIAKIELEPKLEGRQIIMVVAPSNN